MASPCFLHPQKSQGPAVSPLSAFLAEDRADSPEIVHLPKWLFSLYFFDN